MRNQTELKTCQHWSGCNNPIGSFKLCNKHRATARRIGLITGEGKKVRRHPAERFGDHFTIGKADECWPWESAIDTTGYGRFNANDEGINAAHRFAYELVYGPVPAGKQIDHTCHNGSGCAGGVTCKHRRCVNPLHMEAVTKTENTMRGESFTAVNSRKTHCHRDHELAGDNLYIIPTTGARRCRACVRINRNNLGLAA